MDTRVSIVLKARIYQIHEMIFDTLAVHFGIDAVRYPQSNNLLLFWSIINSEVHVRKIILNILPSL